MENTNSAVGCRLVFVGEDGDVYAANGRGVPRKLTFGWNDPGEADRLYYVWPSYSPDGSHVACFGVRNGAMPEAGLYTVADDGVRMHEIWRMREAAPICESWSSDSSRIAILLQSEEDLILEVANVGDPGRTWHVDRGAPLFWAWSPRESYLAVHTGGSRSLYSEARLTVYRVADGCEEVALLAPGEFRTPAWSPDGERLAYVDCSTRGREYLAFYRVADDVREIVYPVDGHTVMLWSPDGKTLAVSQALGDSPHMYSGITLIDVETGKVSPLVDQELASFFWSPQSDRLVVMSFDESSGMRWSTVNVDGEVHHVGEAFYPSRELVYFCWFFDQFAASHPLISPDGNSLVFAGHMTGPGADDDSSANSVYLAPLAGGAPARRVAPGHFACWDTSLREADFHRVG